MNIGELEFEPLPTCGECAGCTVMRRARLLLGDIDRLHQPRIDEAKRWFELDQRNPHAFRALKRKVDAWQEHRGQVISKLGSHAVCYRVGILIMRSGVEGATRVEVGETIYGADEFGVNGSAHSADAYPEIIRAQRDSSPARPPKKPRSLGR